MKLVRIVFNVVIRKYRSYQYVMEIRLCEDVSGTSQLPFCPFSTKIKINKDVESEYNSSF